MIVVAIVGLARSGKDTIAKIFEKQHGFEHFDFYENVIAPIMKAQGKKPSKKTAASFGNEMRSKFGMQVFADKMVEQIKGKPKVVVTGARSLAEIQTLEKAASQFFIVKVEAPSEMRFQRRSDLDPKEEKEFFERDENDLENKGFREVLRLPGFTIENTGTIAELEEKVKAIAEKIAGHSLGHAKP